MEVAQIAAGRLDGFLLIGAEDIDDPVRHLHRHRPDVFRGEDPQAAPLDHGGATHADVGVGSGDDDVAASQQRRVAGEAASRHHADQRHLPAQRAEAREGLGVEAGHDGHVGVARAPPATFGEEHHRKPEPLDQFEEPVLLAVVHLALGAGQDGVVVRQHGTARTLGVEEVAVDPSDAGDEAVGRRVGDEVLGAAARPLGGDDEAAVLLEAVPVAEVLDVLARRAAPARVPAPGRRRTSRVEGGGDAGPQLLELGAWHVAGAGGLFRRDGADRRRVLFHLHEHVARLYRVTDRHGHRGHRSGCRRLHHMLHLHGLQEEQDGPRAPRGRRVRPPRGARCRRRAP